MGCVAFVSVGLEVSGVKLEVPTSTTSAERSVPMAALGPNTNHLAVNILGVVRVDVAGATAAVGDFGGHFGDC
jgi:hypothetical protein